MKKILLVIDMQNDFIDGALGTPEAVAIVDNVKAKIKTYPKEDVFATRDTHSDFYLATQEGKNLPVPHCIRGTDGWQIRPDIAELIYPDHIIDKPTFGSTQLAKLMEIFEARSSPNSWRSSKSAKRKASRSNWSVCAPISVSYPTPC